MTSHALRDAARALLGLALCSLLAASCRAPRAADPAAISARGRPSLQDIFSIPGIHGATPTLRSLSSDGRFALVDFKPVVRTPNGALEWGDDLSPHLLDTSNGPHELVAANSLAALLTRLVPPQAPVAAAADAAAADGSKRAEARPPRTGAMAWSESGALLAVEWLGALVLVEPARGAATVLYRDAPAPTEDGAEAAKSSNPARVGPIRALTFAREDRELEIRTSKELYLLDLSAAANAPLAFEALRCESADLEPAIDKLQLSDDRQRAFLTTGSFGELEGDASKAATRFLERSTGRRVVLEGLAELKALESERLSPDGRYVFGVEADRSKDPPPNLVPNFLSARVSTINARRDLADDLPPPRKLWVWDTRDGSRRELLLPGDSVYHLQTLGWAPQATGGEPARYAFRRLSRDFRVLETWVWSEGDLRLVAVDRDSKWIGGPGGGARWSRDGARIVFASESFASSSTPGHAQVFELDVDTGRVRQLTEVAGEVSSFVQLGDGYALVASGADPNERTLVLASRSANQRVLDLGRGVAESPRASRDGSCVVVSFEQLGRPAELEVFEVASGAQRRLTRTVRAEFAAHDWILPQELVVEHSDGSRIWSHVYLPRGASLERSSRARPCVVFIHGAGYLQNVTQSMTEYAVNLMFHSRLAEMGYVVLDVDYRGSAGYGQRFRTDVQGHLGKLELEDIALCVDELARRKLVDPARVGCYGGSYGGFLTLMALFIEPQRWSCGAALRSVTDWRSYSSGYTQPRLGRPSLDPAAYERSSPIDHAAKLEDPLLILHGMSDTNVFAQDSIRLIETLIDLGKPFDAMLYPSQGHGFEDGAHWIDEYGRIERFMLQHLGAP